jgi:hypothetical protein
MKLHIVKFVDQGPDLTDGGAIFDRRLVEALIRQGADVTVENVTRKRMTALPIWRTAVDFGVIDRARLARSEGRALIISHEALFGIALQVRADALIVHNYFAHFRFRGEPLIEHYYRTGSRRYYRKAFAATRCAFFISYRENALALADHPSLRGRCDICVPPPYPLDRTNRSDSILHISGNDKWRPKQMSRLSDADLRHLAAEGYRITDLDGPVSPAPALINDRFEVGFKLKLAQMLSCRDIIASFCDLNDEIEALCPDTPFYRQVATVEEAIAYFREIAKRYTHHQIDAYYAELEDRQYLPTWDGLAGKILALIAQQAVLQRT